MINQTESRSKHARGRAGTDSSSPPASSSLRVASPTCTVRDPAHVPSRATKHQAAPRELVGDGVSGHDAHLPCRRRRRLPLHAHLLQQRALHEPVCPLLPLFLSHALDPVLAFLDLGLFACEIG